MEPIVNPFLIYLIMMVDTFKSIFVTFSIMLSLSTIYFFVKDYFIKSVSLRLRIFMITVTLVVYLLANLFPNKDTIIAMYVAKQTTPQNISKVYKGIKFT